MRRAGRLVVIASLAHGGSLPAQMPEAARIVFREYGSRVQEMHRTPGEGAFLRIDRLDGARRDAARARALRGEPWLQRIVPRGPDGDEIEPEGAIVHHWSATVFVPDATLAAALALALDLESYPATFAPDVVRAAVLERQGHDVLRVFLRFRKHKVITLTYDTEQRMEVHRPAPDRVWTRSEALVIHEVEDPDTPDERRRAAGEGYFHGLQTWWRYQAVAGGLWIETETLVLTGDVGFPASLLVAPLLRAGPREGVERALEQIATALRGPGPGS